MTIADDTSLQCSVTKSVFLGQSNSSKCKGGMGGEL